MTKVIMQLVGIIMLIMVGISYTIYHIPVALRGEYTTNTSVDKPDKIENAISNVVFDLEKRDFVPVYLEVKWYPASKVYEVYARGIDRTKLCKYKP